MYFLELIPTRACNLKCDYCEIKEPRKEVEVDIDYLKYVLECFDDVNEMFVEICGGEPGLINNLDEVYRILYNTQNVGNIQVMSNGLVRSRGFDWLSDIYYNEHITKPVNMSLPKHDFWKYVVVVNNDIAKELVEDSSPYSHLLKRDDVWWKIIKKIDIYYFIKKFLEKIGDYNTINKIENTDYSKRVLCSMNTPYPAVDFETKKLYHCAGYLNESKNVVMNRKNADRLKKCDLFSVGPYCRRCHIYDNDGKASQIIQSKKGEYCNVGKGYLD